MSETGWFNFMIFLQYLEEHFLKFVKTDGLPVLLRFDGHKSHISLALKEWDLAHNALVCDSHTHFSCNPTT